MTKIVYDGIFGRCDDPDRKIDEAQAHLLDERELISFSCGENVLCGYYYNQNESDSLILVAPGFHSGADDYLVQIEAFLDMGYDVFAFDPTGTDASGGKNSVGFSQEVLDLEAALDCMGIYGYERVCLFGHSRGGYAACLVSERRSDIDAVIAVSGINSAMEAIMHYPAKYAGFLAYGNYPLLWLYQSEFLFDSELVDASCAEAISQSGVPTLIVQGSADSVAPVDCCSIYAYRGKITSDVVEYYYCEKDGQNEHTNLMFEENGQMNSDLMKTIQSFMDRYEE